MKNFLKFQFTIHKKESGFTLIELLIVVAIIGILSTLLIANFIGVRQRGNDAHRKSDLRQMQSALELYRADQGNYPATISNCTCSGSACFMTPDCSSSIYLQKIPIDPSGAQYTYTQSGNGYSLKACLENPNDPDKDANNTCSGGTYSYTLYNP